MKKLFIQILIALFIPLISTSQEITRDLPATLNYKLGLKIDYKSEKIYGNCEMVILNDTDMPLDKIPLLLYRQLTVMSASDQSGNTLQFNQDITSVKGWEKIQVNFVEIALDERLLPGQEAQLKISYEGYLSGYSADGWRYVKDHIARDFTMLRTDGFSYPVIGYPTESEMMAVVRERYDYKLDVTVPAGLKVVTGGKLTGVIRNGDEATYLFHSRKPSWRIDIAIAQYQVISKDKNQIFCFTADSAGAQSMLNVMERTVKTYSEWFGDIQNYSGYSIIEVPEGYGSQADVTSFCLTADNFKNRNDNTALYHELAHLWDVKPLEPEPCRFESEGRAQFLQFVLTEKFENKKYLTNNAISKYLDNIRHEFTKNPQLRSVPVRDYGVADLTSYSYTLGMIIFSMYYDLAGEENFNSAIKSYFSQYSNTGSTLDDFIIICKKHAPFDSEKFFNDWIYTAKGIDMIVKGTSYEDLKSGYISLPIRP